MIHESWLGKLLYKEDLQMQNSVSVCKLGSYLSSVNKDQNSRLQFHQWNNRKCIAYCLSSLAIDQYNGELDTV